MEHYRYKDTMRQWTLLWSIAKKQQTLPVLARSFGVSTKTIQREIQALEETGFVFLKKQVATDENRKSTVMEYTLPIETREMVLALRARLRKDQAIHWETCEHDDPSPKCKSCRRDLKRTRREHNIPQVLMEHLYA